MRDAFLAVGGILLWFIGRYRHQWLVDKSHCWLVCQLRRDLICLFLCFVLWWLLLCCFVVFFGCCFFCFVFVGWRNPLPFKFKAMAWEKSWSSYKTLKCYCRHRTICTDLQHDRCTARVGIFFEWTAILVVWVEFDRRVLRTDMNCSFEWTINRRFIFTNQTSPAMGSWFVLAFKCVVIYGDGSALSCAQDTRVIATDGQVAASFALIAALLEKLNIFCIWSRFRWWCVYIQVVVIVAVTVVILCCTSTVVQWMA